MTLEGRRWQQYVLWVLLVRLIDSLVICTFFDPDEYWQSLEVAHYSVYGYGAIMGNHILRKCINGDFLGLGVWTCEVMATLLGNGLVGYGATCIQRYMCSFTSSPARLE
jgi:hypothetical protein